MQAYINPDISELREIPKAETEKLLGIDDEMNPPAPDTLFVSQLLNMIRVAREAA